MRGETGFVQMRNVVKEDFNPLSPCGERPYPKIHGVTMYTFQSTLPMRGETSIIDSAGAWDDPISIHSPHAGRDKSGKPRNDLVDYFNPLSPCGERQAMAQAGFRDF